MKIQKFFSKNFLMKILFFSDKKIFKKFKTEVLTKFTSFECLSGYYKQTYGCNMGSKISPILPNIFLSILEAKFIDENIDNGNILAYKRFVDDIFLRSNKLEVT